MSEVSAEPILLSHLEQASSENKNSNKQRS